MSNKSHGYLPILIASVGLTVTSLVSPETITPGHALAFAASFFLLDVLGMFRVKEPESDVEARQEKIAEIDKELNKDLEAVLHMEDKNGKKGTVIIAPDGSVTVEGDVDPEVVKAMLTLRDLVKTAGPEVVAKELDRQLRKAGHIK